MTRTVLLCLTSLLVLGTLAFAQTLAEVAKKEKERRKDLSSETEVIDDWDLAQADGSTFSSTGKPADSGGTMRVRTRSRASTESPSTGARSRGNRPSGGSDPGFSACLTKYRRAQSDLRSNQRILDEGLVAHRSSTTTDAMGRPMYVKTEAARGKKLTCSYLMARPNDFPQAAWKCKFAKASVAKHATTLRQIENECMGLASSAGMSPGQARSHFR